VRGVLQVSLSRLGEICPSLSYNLAKYKLRATNTKYVHAVVPQNYASSRLSATAEHTHRSLP